MKCPECGKDTFNSYNHKIGWGLGAAAVGAILLGPVGLVAGALGADDSFTGYKCSSCGYKEANETSEKQRARNAKIGNAMSGVGKEQFRKGYEQGLEMYSSDDDD